MKTIVLLPALLAAVSLSGCSAEQAYGMAQGWQRNQCSRVPDKMEYDRCMSNASTGYDSYRQGAEAKPK